MRVYPPLVLVVDELDFRRAILVRFLVAWSAQERVSLLSLRFEEASQELHDNANECRMVILNAGAVSCSDPDVLSKIEIIRTLAPSTAIAVVANEDNPADVVAAMQAGVAAYISNRSNPDIVLKAFSIVLGGGTYFPRTVVAVATETFSETPSCPEPESSESMLEDQARPVCVAGFSERQRSILAGVCRGEPNKIIGRRLGLPESTVKVHVREIMRKLGVSNRTQVAVVAASLADSIGDLTTPPSKEPSRRLPIPFPHATKVVVGFEKTKVVVGFENGKKLGENPSQS
jgi:DNA-binding NarL/FixJ family response regulator